MLTLRPHHLLCTHAWRGNGYSQAFSINFDGYLAQLQQPGTRIQLTLTHDPICTACPKLSGTSCQTEAHIHILDLAVLTTFQLQLGVSYDYNDLIQQLQQRMTHTHFATCCATCSWFEQGICQRIWCL
ncbi:MAG: DUF1284 domain-containing protein [Culicoidibacterales bacterium]